MVNYMVALDNSNYAKAAFFTAVCMLEQKRDRLFLITIVPDLRSYYLDEEGAASAYMQMDHMKSNARELLSKYSKYCSALGINYEMILGVSDHTGEAICEQVKGKGIDFLVLGRRGMSKISRFFAGSTSKYCMENADCIVVTTKGEWGPSEVHEVSREQIRELEEAERKRRIAEEQIQDQKEKVHSEMDRKITRVMEETERQLRIEEEKKQLNKEEEQRVAAHIGAVIEEEKERQRRIQEFHRN